MNTGSNRNLSHVPKTTISSSSSRSNRLDNLSHLITRPDDLLPLPINRVLHILVLPLGSLPDLDLAPSPDDTDTHRTQQVVSGIAMHVDATVEHGGGILADTRRDHGFAARVILDEGGNIVDNTRNGDESAPVLRLVMVFVPFHDGELVERYTPVELGAFDIDLLLDLLDAALFDLVGAKLLEIVGETELLPRPDGPFGGIVLPPIQRIAVVRGELVVEVVVAFAEGDESGEDVVTGRVAVVERLIT